MPHLRAQPATEAPVGTQRPIPRNSRHGKQHSMLHEEADEALMLRYQQGEVRAFEILLTRHRKPVFNFILRFVQNRELAEDLLQEAFLRVIRSAAKYKRQAKFTTWLYTIARNLCVDQSRRAKHRKAQSLDAPMSTSEGSGSLLDVVAGDQLPSDRTLVSKEIHIKLQAALAELSEDQREVSSAWISSSQPGSPARAQASGKTRTRISGGRSNSTRRPRR